MRATDIRICAWAAPLATAFFLLALVPAMRFVPPLSPQLSAQAIAAIYRNNAVGIEIGAVLMVTATTLLIPFVGAISAVIERMDDPPKALSNTQLLSGLLGFAPLMYASYMFAAAAFRPDRGADFVLALNDVGWIFLVMTPGLMQPLAIGLAILLDKSRRPLFPRWLGFANLWFGLIFLGGEFNPLFKGGPLAWNGLIAFWMPVVAFSGWVFSMFWGVLRAARQIDADHRP